MCGGESVAGASTIYTIFASLPFFAGWYNLLLNPCGSNDMRHSLKTISLLIGCLLTLTACAQTASVGIPTPSQATREVQQVAPTASQVTNTPIPPLPTETPAPQQTPTSAPAQAADTAVPETATAELPAATATAVPSTGSASVACNRTVTYIVKPGDNLFRIALRYRTTIQAIARRNGISNTRVIRAGQRLRIVTCARS
jgi:LysM repeat protein